MKYIFILYLILFFLKRLDKMDDIMSVKGIVYVNII